MSDIKKKGLTKEEVIAVITQEIPRLISEHPEIRYELIGMMSEVFVKKDEYREILAEIKALREDFNRRFEEHSQEIKALREATNRHAEEIKALREATNRHAEEIKALREATNRNTEEIKALREATNRNAEEIKALREDFNRRFEEHSQEIKALRKATNRNTQEIKNLCEDVDKNFKNLNNRIEGFGARWGMMSEEAFRNGLKAILTEEFGVKVERYFGNDKEGFVFGRPDQIEMDIIVKDGILILVEIKSSTSKSDVSVFQRKVEFYEKEHNVKVNRKVIISPVIEPQAVTMAQSLEIEIYTSALDTRI